MSREKTLSGHVEALVGAALLSGGWPGATAMVHRLLQNRWPAELPPPDARRTSANPLTALNEAVQARWQQSIPKDDWVVTRVGGPDNQPVHEATVRLPDNTYIVGSTVTGKKDAAKASAAWAALDYIDTLEP